MNEIEKMRQYIAKTETEIDERTRNRFDLAHSEMWELLEMCRSEGADGADGAFYAIGLAFSYGVAKGFRAAKAKQRAAARSTTRPKSN